MSLSVLGVCSWAGLIEDEEKFFISPLILLMVKHVQQLGQCVGEAQPTAADQNNC